MNLTPQDHVARIEQKQTEVRTFVAEQRILSAKDARTLWLFPIAGMVVGPALFGAGAVFVKLLGA